MCDGGDDCGLVRTTCCRERRPKCETADVTDEDGTITSTICLLGFGCAPDAAHYIAKLAERFS